MPDGQIGYTRNGAFMRNAEGTVVTASGYPLQPEIQIPADAATITVSSDGIVSVQTPGDVEAQEVGQITLADFSNRQGLQPNGESMLIETPASGAAIIANPFAEGMGRLVQGSLESSNVNVVQELVDMIETQRAYEVSSKTITSASLRGGSAVIRNKWNSSFGSVNLRHRNYLNSLGLSLRWSQPFHF